MPPVRSPVQTHPLALAPALSFDAVYEAHFDYVHRVVARLAGRGDVEDLVQETFLVAYRKLPSFEGRAHVTTWLFRIAYHVTQSHARRNRFRRALLTLLAQAEPEPDRGPDPGARLEDGERARLVRGALDKLPFKKRTVLVLFEVEGWSCTQIAEKLGVPVNTVYSRLHHARADFERVLERLNLEGGSR